MWKEEPSETYWADLAEWSELTDVRSLSEAGQAGRPEGMDWVWLEGCVPVVLLAGRVVLPWLEPARLEPASLPEMLTWRCWPAGRVICMSRRRMPFWDGGLGERRTRLPRLFNGTNARSSKTNWKTC